MTTRFTWDPAKAARNQRKHGVSFETAREVLADPNHIVSENYDFEAEGERRCLAIVMTRDLVLVVAYSLIEARRRPRSFTSFQRKGGGL